MTDLWVPWPQERIVAGRTVTGVFRLVTGPGGPGASMTGRSFVAQMRPFPGSPDVIDATITVDAVASTVKAEWVNPANLGWRVAVLELVETSFTARIVRVYGEVTVLPRVAVP